MTQLQSQNNGKRERYLAVVLVQVTAAHQVNEIPCQRPHERTRKVV
ncbi:unnamed protein product [uncultured virus]|nr:unnamed protein product [uncultured virus]